MQAGYDFGDDPSAASGLRPGERLLAGRPLASPSGRFVLEVDPREGELVLTDRQTGSVLWCSETPQSGAVQVVMQPGGNLVLLSQDGVQKWSTGTAGQPGSRLTVHDDGQLAVYSPMGIPIWQSHSALSV
jgi:hypothetical protein